MNFNFFLSLFSLAILFLCMNFSTTLGTVYDVGVVGTTFSPANVTVNIGDSVNWSWDTNLFHSVYQTIVPSNCTAFANGFTSGSASETGNYTKTFNSLGTFYYACIVHCSIGMRGHVMVVNGTAPSTTSGTTATSGTTTTPSTTSGTTSAVFSTHFSRFGMNSFILVTLIMMNFEAFLSIANSVFP